MLAYCGCRYYGPKAGVVAGLVSRLGEAQAHLGDRERAEEYLGEARALFRWLGPDLVLPLCQGGAGGGPSFLCGGLHASLQEACRGVGHPEAV